MRIAIEDVPPSLNKLLRLHWAARSKLKKLWMEHLWIMKPMRHITGDCKAKVTITVFHSRTSDKDNLYASVKPVLDAMKELEIIVDDSPAWLELEVNQELCKRAQVHTIIQVDPIG